MCSWESFPTSSVRMEAEASIRHRQAAANAQYLSGDVIRPGAQKEHDRLGDLNWLGDPAKRDGPGQRLLHPLRLALEERRVGRTGADAIDVDAVTREFPRKRFGKRDQPALRRGINGFAGAADAPRIA